MKHLIYFGVMSILMLLYSIHAESKILGVVFYIFYLVSFICFIVAYIIQ